METKSIPDIVADCLKSLQDTDTYLERDLAKRQGPLRGLAT